MDGEELLGQYAAGIRSFQSADLRGIKFENANFSGADFSGADLSGANLTAVDLQGIDLSQTKCWGTVMPGSIF